MSVGPATSVLGWLDHEADEAADPAILARLRTGDAISITAHGTVIGHAGSDAQRRRVFEFDRDGTLLTALEWSAAGLDRAWLRLPDRAWLAVEPRATSHADWGPSDRLRRCDRLGADGATLTVFETVDHRRPDRIPTLAEPARLPPGAGAIVLNLLATLAADAGVPTLVYGGPYPSEQLFLALLEGFRYEATVGAPLAAFIDHSLTWRPAPHERRFTAQGVYVQLRERIEKVVWSGHTYYRPDWQAVARHAPRRVRDEGERVYCSLWALGTVVEDHLALTPDGAVIAVIPMPLHEPNGHALPRSVAEGIGAVVAATSAAPLAPFIRETAGAMIFTWGPVSGDLIAVDGTTVRVSSRLRARIGERLRAAAHPPAVALAALGELAHLVGDVLRGRAQRRVADLPAAAQETLLTTPPPADSGAARVITAAVEALLEEFAPGVVRSSRESRSTR